MPRYPALSSAAEGLSSRVYTSLVTLAREHAPELFPLNVGDTYRSPPRCAQAESLLTRDLPGLHNYAEVQGDPRLLDAVVADLARRNRPVPRERIQITAGATSGLDIACRSLLGPGDEVILLAPYWPLIRGIISAAGARAVELPLFTELRKPGFDLRAALQSVLSARTTVLYVNTPHNPTGVVLHEQEREILATFAAEHGLWVLSDEAYERLHFTSEAPLPLWTHPLLSERTVVAHTLSKSYGIAGARIGFVHGPEQAMQAVFGLETFATYCAAKPMQLAAARALSDPEGEQWVLEARDAYARAAQQAAACVGVPTPESGTFLFFDSRPFLREGESPLGLLERCARAGVVLTPGTATGQGYASFARLCFTAVSPDRLERALDVLQGVLRDH